MENKNKHFLKRIWKGEGLVFKYYPISLNELEVFWDLESYDLNHKIGGINEV